MKLEHLSRPVRYLYVCPAGHVGAPGRKARAGRVKTKPCFVCGEPAELKPVSPSGRTRRRKKLPDTAVRPEEEFEQRHGALIEPEPFSDDFALSADQVRQFADGEVPTISFPLTGMPPLKSGRVYRVTDDLNIYVTGYRETKTHLVARFEIHRAEQAVRSDAIHVERSATHMSARRHPKTGEFEMAEPEAERLTKQEVAAMSKEVLEAELEKKKKLLGMQEAVLRELEKDFSRDEVWGARKTVEHMRKKCESMETRIRELDKGLRGNASAARR